MLDAGGARGLPVVVSDTALQERWGAYAAGGQTEDLDELVSHGGEGIGTERGHRSEISRFKAVVHMGTEARYVEGADRRLVEGELVRRMLGVASAVAGSIGVMRRRGRRAL